jgi:hypothetical protein
VALQRAAAGRLLPPPMSPPPIRLLSLFEGRWETDAVDAAVAAGALVVRREGFEPMSRSGFLRLCLLDAARWADRLVARHRGHVDAVWSNDEPFGCLLAAVLAERLGVPGAAPAAIVRAQHKVLLREALARHCPEFTISAAALPASLADRRWRDRAWIAAAAAGAGIGWPTFCKPVKGTFSALARRVDSVAELAAHVDLALVDRLLLARLARPFTQLAAQAGVPLPCPPDAVLLEAPMRGRQVNVECMYPGEAAGAHHFSGFTYPSRLPADVQAKACDAALAALAAIGFTHGLANVELFVLADGSPKVIEVNPRAAGQFATMYRSVLGLDLERLAIAVAAGRDPATVPRVEPRAGAAASFVFRRFDGRPAPMPDAEALAWQRATFPDARLWLEPARGAALRREYRWLGSHRYAVLNHAAADFDRLLAEGERMGRRLFGVGVLPA